MKKLILIFTLAISLMTNICEAKSIKFVQITDTQYSTAGMNEELTNAITQINKMKDINFVVFTGDNVAMAGEENLNGFIKATEKLKKPFYLVVGDKDVSKSKKMPKEVYAKKLHKLLGRKSPKTLNYSFYSKKKDIAFIVVDGAKDFLNMPNGYFNKTTMKWLKKELEKNRSKKIVLLQHFPVATKNTNEMVMTANAKEYLNLINDYGNVIAVISGHFNMNDENLIHNVYFVETPSLKQNCYKIIEIDPDNEYQVFTSLIQN